MTQSIHTPEQQKWFSKLMGYNYQILYTPGKENTVADALSRTSDKANLVSFHAFSVPTWPPLQQLKDFYHSNPVGKALTQKLLNKLDTKFSLKSVFLYFENRLYIPTETGMQHTLIKEFHSTPMGGYSGFKATLDRISTTFYWPCMYKDVKELIRQCATCQFNKYIIQSPYGLLQPLHTPNQVWEEISMDFITNLPLSNNKTAIWVVVDQLSKFARFIASPTGRGVHNNQF